MKAVYLDYNATTPIDPRVAETMQPFLGETFGNPSSSHQYGVAARQLVENARLQLSLILNARPDEIIFTGGGTESNNLALKGFAFMHAGKGGHIITTAVEHPAVTEVCRYLAGFGFEITILGVDGFGMIDPDDFKRAIRPATILASIMHANNEVGTIQPVEEIGRICREHGITLHCDAAQSVGKIPVDVQKMNVDLLSVAGHKFYAPKGVGALYCRRGISLTKMQHGADHERELRAGTENIMGIAGLGKAAQLVTSYELRMTNHSVLVPGDEKPVYQQVSDITALCDRLHRGIVEAYPTVRLNGHPELRLPNTLSLGFKGRDASVLLNDWKGLAASAGAACHAGLETISAVLLAMKVPRDYALGTIRFSVGRMTTNEEIDLALEIITGNAGSPRLISRPGQLPFIQGHTDTAPSEGALTAASAGIEKIPSAGVETELSGVVETIPSAGIETVTQSAFHKDKIRLTEYTHALGCACKIKPQALEKILRVIPRPSGKNILVGTETSDDAAVYLISSEKAIVQTVDFIPPVVDDPYQYGAIAAANALSDVWAMGGKPLFALSILAFPEKKIPFEVLQEIIRGAVDKVTEAGISIIGGHSIEDEEPKFGLVVSGEVNPDKIWRNSTPEQGDVLILTKPLGTGILSTAVKREYAGEKAAREAITVMSMLNKIPAEVLMDYDVHACTDVTGFGLLGHLKEMLSARGLGAELYWEKVPLLSSVWEYAVAGMIPGGSRNNLEFVSGMLDCGPTVPALVKLILADAQTSGGLLVSLPEAQADRAVSALRSAGISAASAVGKITGEHPFIKIL